MGRRLRTLGIALLLGLTAIGATTGCGRPQPVAAQAPKPKPRNAIQLAIELSGARLTSMLRVDRLRGHALAPKLAELDDVRELLEGTGVDPLRDLERVFVASSGVHRDDKAVIVAEHKLAEEKLKAAMDALVARSQPPGAWMKESAVPAARVTLRGHARVIAAVAPSFVVVVPETLAGGLRRFEGTGGFPEQDGAAALVTDVKEPAVTLRVPRAPRIPETISTARITVELSSDGGADVKADALSASPEQAVEDARSLTEAIERATTVKVAFVRVRFFQAAPFRAEGDRVESRVHLSEGELHTLLRVAPQLSR